MKALPSTAAQAHQDALLDPVDHDAAARAASCYATRNTQGFYLAGSIGDMPVAWRLEIAVATILASGFVGWDAHTHAAGGHGLVAIMGAVEYRFATGNPFQLPAPAPADEEATAPRRHLRLVGGGS